MEGGRVACAVVSVVVRIAAAPVGTLLSELEFRVVGVVRRAVVGGDCRDVGGDRADSQVQREAHRVLQENRASDVREAGEPGQRRRMIFFSRNVLFRQRFS